MDVGSELIWCSDSVEKNDPILLQSHETEWLVVAGSDGRCTEMFYTLALCLSVIPANRNTVLWSVYFTQTRFSPQFFHFLTPSLSDPYIDAVVNRPDRSDYGSLTDTCKNHTGGVSGVYELSVMCS